MSLSNPTTKNPATKFIEWSGSKGMFKYYDKDKKEDVYFEDSIYVIPLDELSTIKGFDSDNNCGYYSNEVKYLDKEPFYVKSFKGGKVETGLWKDLKLPSGCKFAKSIYCAMITGNKEKSDIELVNFQLYGSSIGSWIEAKVKVESGEVVMLAPSNVKLTKGTTEYFAPKILKMGKRQDIIDRCINMDKELQKYLDVYLKSDKTETDEIKKDVEIDDFNDVDDLPF